MTECKCGGGDTTGQRCGRHERHTPGKAQRSNQALIQQLYTAVGFEIKGMCLDL